MERGVGEAFQELSDLLLPANRLPGGRLLHELSQGKSLSTADLRHILREIEQAARRLVELLPLLEPVLDLNRLEEHRQDGAL